MFRAVCLDEAGNETDHLTFEYAWYEPMTDDAVAAQLDRLRTNFPRKTDFGSREPKERKPTPWQTDVYTPASDEAIADYTEKKYPDWLRNCEAILRNYHESLQRAEKQLQFCFSVLNEGSRPGRDALITFTAKGPFQVCPPQDEEDEAMDCLELPSPPVPPHGEWKRGNLLDELRRLDKLRETLNFGPTLPDLTVPPITIPGAPDARHDPNAFYYKGRSKEPEASFSLSCDQWRHGGEEEEFVGEVVVDLEVGGGLEVAEVSGILECRIEAENLSDPVEITVPVKITIKRFSAKDRAEKLIDGMTRLANLLQGKGADSKKDQ